MPRINLLPTKQAQHSENARKELFLIIVSLFLLFMGLYSWNGSITQDINLLKNKISLIEEKLFSLKKEVSRVEDFKVKSEKLEKKDTIIEKLKKQKFGPAKMFNDLANILTQTEKIWLTSIKENEERLVFEGGAMDHEDISKFQISLAQDSNFFTLVHLDNIQTKFSDKIRYLQWKITCIPDFSAE